MGVATKQILSGIGHGASSRGSREGRRRERGDGPPQSSTATVVAAGEKVVGNQHPLEQNHVTSSAIGERSPSPRRFPVPAPSQGSQSPDKHSTPPSRHRSPDPDIIQLFVKNIPSTMAPTEVSKLAEGESVDLTEEVYSADVPAFQSMDFGPTRTTDVPSNNPIPSHVPSNNPIPSLPLPLSAADDNQPTGCSPFTFDPTNSNSAIVTPVKVT